MTFLIAIFTLLALWVSSYGYGFAFLKWGIRDEAKHFFFPAIIGTACLILMGGVLNALSLAYPAAMYLLLVAGMAFGLMAWFPGIKSLASSPQSLIPGAVAVGRGNFLLPLGIVVISTAFFAVTLLPSDAFNFHDDFHTYMPRPVRMLQTGTLSGNPFELLGLDSLGAQAFLQGFILLKLPLQYLPGLDAVFGFGMAGLLLVAAARKFKVSWLYSTPAVLTFIAINPQSVNVSALYTGTFTILGLLFTGCLLMEKINHSPGIKSMGMAVLSGLLIAALVALKTTMALYAAIYFALLCAGLLALTRDMKLVFRLAGITILAALIALSPWLLLHASHYTAMLHANPSSNSTSGGFALPKGNVSDLLSTHDLFYGGSLMGYGAIIVVLALLGTLLSFTAFRRSRQSTQQQGYALVAASACAAAIATYFLNGLLFDFEAAVRYACPVLIAALPFTLLVAGQNTTVRQQDRSLATTASKTAIIAGATLVALLFWSNLIDRIELTYQRHTTVSFPINEDYIQYNRYVLSEQAKQEIGNIQAQTAAGERILAWISMPLLLDFSRNDIFTLMEPGLLNPWLELPLDGDPMAMARYFKKQGIRYILWEYQGDGMKPPGEYQNMLHSPFPTYRRIGERNLYMRDMLISLMRGGTFLYHQEGMVLFDLDQIIR